MKLGELCGKADGANVSVGKPEDTYEGWLVPLEDSEGAREDKSDGTPEGCFV